MSSVSRRRAWRVGAIAIGLASMICGCATTQQTAARLQLNDARLRAVSTPVRLTVAASSAPVREASESLVSRGTHLTDVVVSLDNPTANAVSDLPISVGYHLGRRTVYLNAAAGLNYFDNHIPSISAHGSLSWVYAVTGNLPPGAHGFAYVGARPTAPVGHFTLPQIAVGTPTMHRATNGAETLTLQLTNRTSIPQYQLPVYAVARVAGRVVAAGDRSLADLSGGARVMVRIGLDGSAAAGGTAAQTVQVEAPATIFK